MAKKEIDHDKFKNIASGVQSLVIALGVLIGGVWTLYLFTSLNTRARALAEFEELKRKNHQGVITIDIKAEQEDIPDDKGRSIKINIQATNLGDSNSKLKLGDSPLIVIKLQPDNEGRLHKEWVKTSDIPYFNPDKLASPDSKPGDLIEPQDIELLRAGQTESFPTWFHVEEAGLYFIEFAPELTGDDLKKVQQATGEPNRIFRATGQTFIVVK